MNTKHDLYKNYTSTSSLAAGIDENAIIAWSKGYFRAFYSTLLPRNKGVKILEVGCGYGKYLQALSEMGYKDCYGIDLSPEQISYAQSVLGLANVELADALEWLDGKEAMFDCILAIDILEHLENEALLDLVEKINMALKPDGIAIFQVPNAMSPLNPITYGDLTHVRAFTPDSMQQLFLNTGFDPSGYYEIPVYVHGIRSAIRRIVWAILFRPAIGLFVRMVHGKVMGGDIYTSNFIAVAYQHPDTSHE